MKTVQLLNATINNLTQRELLERLSRSGGFVVTPNVDHLVKLNQDPQLAQAYRLADFCICDSRILQYISYILKTPIKEKISGSDLLPAFYEYNKNNHDTTIFLLGGMPGVAEQAKRNINQKVEREIVLDTYAPPLGFEKDEQENRKIINLINKSGATVVAVGLGVSKQERWIVRYRKQLPKVKTFLAIGAAIDFEANNKPRAPKWSSKLGLEWLYRLSTEPRRLWKRYLVDSIPFFWWIAQQSVNRYKVAPQIQLYSYRVGEILKEVGLLEQEQLEMALAKQQTTGENRRLGEIIVDCGWVQAETLDFLIDELPQMVLNGGKLRLGEYLRESGLLTQNQINCLLEEQRITGKPLGKLIVQRGWIKKETIEWFLAVQENSPQLSSEFNSSVLSTHNRESFESLVAIAQ